MALYQFSRLPKNDFRRMGICLYGDVQAICMKIVIEFLFLQTEKKGLFINVYANEIQIDYNHCSA